MSDFHFINISIPVINRKEFIPPLVHIIIATKLFWLIERTSPSDINAQAIGEPDIVTSVIKYDKKNDFTGYAKKSLKNSIFIPDIMLLFKRSSPTNNTVRDIQTIKTLRTITKIFSRLNFLSFLCFLSIFNHRKFGSMSFSSLFICLISSRIFCIS